MCPSLSLYIGIIVYDMSVLKYTKSDGSSASVGQYKVTPVIVTQEKGNNPDEVMSQKAVSNEVNEINSTIEEVKSSVDEVKGAVEDVKSEIGQDYLSKESAEATYQPKGDYLTEHQSLAEYAKSSAVSSAIETAVADKATKSSVTSEMERATAKEAELQSALETAQSALAAEKERAQAKEKELTEALAAAEEALEAEKERAQAKEAELMAELAAPIDCGTY